MYMWAPADADSAGLDAALEAPWVPMGFTEDSHKAAGTAEHCTRGKHGRAMRVYKLVEVMHFGKRP